ERHPGRTGSVLAAGERLNAGHHAHRQRLPAGRADAAGGAGLLRREPLIARPVPVEVILPLLGEELDREQELRSVAPPERAEDLAVVERAVEHVRLPP